METSFFNFSLYFVLFWCLYYISVLISPIFPLYRRLTEEEKVDWNTRIISNVHAISSLLGASYCLFFDPVCSKDYLFGHSIACDWVISISLAYWTFDLTLILIYYKAIGDIGMIVHHAAGILPFCLGKIYGELFGYGFWIIWTELSTPLVNNRWYIAMLKKYPERTSLVSGDKLELINGIGMWFAFLFCRVINLPLLLWSMYNNYSRIYKHGHPIVYITVISGTVVVTLLSFYWFYKITNGVLRRLKLRSTKSKL